MCDFGSGIIRERRMVRGAAALLVVFFGLTCRLHDFGRCGCSRPAARLDVGFRTPAHRVTVGPGKEV